MKRLTKEEKETIIRFDEASEKTSIFTYNRRWQRHLEKKLGMEPTWKNSFGGKDYLLPKEWIRLPLPKRRLSPKQQQVAMKGLEKAHMSAKTHSPEDVNEP